MLAQRGVPANNKGEYNKMTSNFKLTLLSSVAAAAVTVMTAGTANATFGMLPHCVGTVKCAMGGAGSTRGVAAVDAVVNPAVGTQMGNTYQINLGWFKANVTGKTQANYGAGTVRGPIQNSAADSFPNGSLGVNYVLDDNMTFNLSIAPGGGGASKWATPRTAGAGKTTTDQEITYEMVYLQPSVAYKVSDSASYGVGAIISRATMKTDSIYGNFVDLANPNKKETFYGAGFQLGGVWALGAADVGLNYRSPVWHQETGIYNNKVFSSPVDTPQQITGGISFNPFDKTTLAFDVKWVDWDGTETIGSGPGSNPAGFGWIDQFIYMVGIEHQLTDDMNVRAGFSHGNSPIDSSHVFANFLFPAIVEDHITVGGDYALGNGMKVGLSSYFSPENKITDSGAGDSYSRMGAGTWLAHEQYGFQLSFSNEF